MKLSHTTFLQFQVLADQTGKDAKSYFSLLAPELRNIIKVLLIHNNSISSVFPPILKKLLPIDEAFHSKIGKINSNIALLTFNGKWALMGNYDNTATLWNLENSDDTLCYKLAGHKGQIKSLAVTSNGKWLITGALDGTALLWDISDKTNIRSFELRGHSEGLTAVALTDNGEWALTGSKDKTIKLWDITDLENTKSYTVETHPKEITAVLLTPDGRWALTACSSCAKFSCLSANKSWHIELPSQKIETRMCISDYNSIRIESCDLIKAPLLPSALSITPDGNWALTCPIRSTRATVWDLKNDASIVLEGHTSFISSACLSQDGQRALTGSLDGTLRLWSLEDPKKVHSIILHHGNKLNKVYLSSDGCSGLSGDEDGMVIYWNLRDINTIRPLIVGSHSDRIVTLSLTPNHRWALTGSSDGVLKYWDLSPAQDKSLCDIVWMLMQKKYTLPDEMKEYYLGDA